MKFSTLYLKSLLFMDKKAGIEKSVVIKPYGWNAQVWNVLQPLKSSLLVFSIHHTQSNILQKKKLPIRTKTMIVTFLVWALSEEFDISERLLISLFILIT